MIKVTGPDGTEQNFEYQRNTRVNDFLSAAGIKPEKKAVILVNDVSAKPKTRLKDGDKITVRPEFIP